MTNMLAMCTLLLPMAFAAKFDGYKGLQVNTNKAWATFGKNNQAKIYLDGDGKFNIMASSLDFLSKNIKFNGVDLNELIRKQVKAEMAKKNSGCADGSSEGLIKTHFSVSACAGTFSGPIGGKNAKDLCDAGWHVCNGLDVWEAELTLSDRSDLAGCYVFDSMHDCGGCWSTCSDKPKLSAINGFTKGCLDSGAGHDIGAFGAGCTFSTSPSCVSLKFRSDASAGIKRIGCNIKSIPAGKGGVLCCKDSKCPSTNDKPMYHDKAKGACLKCPSGHTCNGNSVRKCASTNYVEKNGCYKCPSGYKCNGATKTKIVTGCKDGSSEGLYSQYKTISACKGTFSGNIQTAGTKALCASGWHVCKGQDVWDRKLSKSAHDKLAGCYAFDSMHDCGGCWSNCHDKPTKSGINGKGGCLDKGAGHDLAGFGKNCKSYGGPSCVSSSFRIDVSDLVSRSGCEIKKITNGGVLCCKN